MLETFLSILFRFHWFHYYSYLHYSVQALYGSFADEADSRIVWRSTLP